MELDPARGVHYLDHAATSYPKPQAVVQSMIECCATACAPGRSTYDLALQSETLLLEARRRLARFFGGDDPNRLVFGYNATDALNLVIFGFLRRGGHVVSTRLEHNSVLRPIAHCCAELGATATLVDFDGAGYVDPDDIRRAIRPDTRLVVCTHGSNVLGTVQPVAEIGALCRQAGVPFCIDAAQTAGCVPIDLRALQVDLMAFTGHKSLLGPMGIGGLCVAPGVDVPHSRAGGTGVDSARRTHLEQYPYRLEYGTPNLVGIAGLAAGVASIEAQGGVEQIQARELSLGRLLWEGLCQLDGVELYGPTSLDRRIPIFSFNLRHRDPAEVGARLDVDFGVASRVGLHCAPLVHETLGTAPRGAIRFSLGPLTTEDDVRAGLAAVQALLAEGR